MPHTRSDADMHCLPLLDLEFIQYLEDREFDMIYPEKVQRRSQIHWSPIHVAQYASRFLVTAPCTRVLDIGCGPGKFCAIGASVTEGFFTGVEQRDNLVRAARKMILSYGLLNVEIIHANIKDICFQNFDAFYLFNPFQENLWKLFRIDALVEVKPQLYLEYSRYVAHELAQCPDGTRVVTYWGDGDEIPACYKCVETAFGNHLQMWIKQGADSHMAASARGNQPRSKGKKPLHPPKAPADPLRFLL